MIAPEPNFEHLVRISDRRGTFERAELNIPRREHGYRTDDMARVLVVTSREADPGPHAHSLGRIALQFVARAQEPDGSVLARMDSEGTWLGEAGTGDAWGRSLWGLGTAAGRANDHRTRAVALELFDRGAQARPRDRRASAFAVLGAAEVLAQNPNHAGARALMIDAAEIVGTPADDPRWPWPEPRLTYANAALPDAMVAAGSALGRPELVEQGLVLLQWLLERETHRHHLSVTPVGGGGRRRSPPAFDQRPIEVATLADALARAAEVSGDPAWTAALHLAVNWFLGDNDLGVAMFDPLTGGGYDGLTADGPDRNQGAESTLALVATLQHARRLAPVSA